jgi:archaellum component FlaC
MCNCSDNCVYEKEIDDILADIVREFNGLKLQNDTLQKQITTLRGEIITLQNNVEDLESKILEVSSFHDQQLEDNVKVNELEENVKFISESVESLIDNVNIIDSDFSNFSVDVEVRLSKCEDKIFDGTEV